MNNAGSDSDRSGQAQDPTRFLEAYEEETPVSPFAIVNVLLRDLWLIVLLPLVAFGLVAAASWFGSDTRYMSESQFMLASGGGGGGGGLGAQIAQLTGGGGGGGGNSPTFYAALLESRSLTRDAAATELTAPTAEGDTLTGSLADHYSIPTASPASELRTSHNLMRSSVSAFVNPIGFVVLRTTAPTSGLAVAINERMLELVNDFNVEQRQSQATAERRFIEERMAEKEEELLAAEERYRRWLEQNQLYENSPRLRFEANRLERQVGLRQSVYTSLAQSYENARLAEVRNLPLITVIEPPELRVSAQRGRPVFRGFVAAIVTFLVVVGYVLIKAYFQRTSKDYPDDFDEFRRLYQSKVRAIPRLSSKN